MLSLNSKYIIQRLYHVKKSQRILLYSTATPSFSNYLVNSLGFSHQQAALTCSKLPINKVDKFKFYDNAVSVVGFLKNNGIDDTHLRKAVSLYPRILCNKVEKTLKPKFELLQDEGFSGPDCIRVISATPNLSGRCMNHVISDLRDVLGSVENVTKTFSKSSLFTSSVSLENMISNIALLKNDYGIDTNVIRNTIVLNLCPFLRNPEFFRNVVVRVEEELGIPRDSKMFFKGLHLLCGFSKKNIESKCELFKSYGWTEYQISELMKRNPFTFSLSTENLTKKLGFLMNERGLDPAFLASHFVLFNYSLEKRILPRHRVLLVLKEKGLLDCNFYKAARKTETDFMKTFVEPFKDVAPGLHEIYQNRKG